MLRLSFYEKFIVIMALSLGLNFLPNIIFPGWRFTKYFGIIALIVLSFLFNTKARHVINRPKSFTIIALIITPIFVLECLFALTNYPETSARAIVLLTIHLAFALFLNKILSRIAPGLGPGEAVLCLLRPYFYLSLAIVSTSLVVGVLGLLDFINVGNYPIPAFLGYEFNNRIEELGVLSSGLYEISFPLNLAIVGNYSRILSAPFVLLGWSYEPHVAALFLTPAIFFTPFIVKKKAHIYSVYAAFGLFLIFAGSLTNIIALFICLFIVGFRYSIPKFIAIALYILIPIVIVASTLSKSEPLLFLTGFFDLFDRKVINPSGSSFETTLFYWSYLYQSNVVFGDGFLRVPRLGEVSFVPGFFSAVNITIIYLGFVVLFAGLYRLRDRFSLQVAGAILYLIVHSLKFPNLIANYPFYTFWAVIGVFWLTKEGVVAIGVSPDPGRLSQNRNAPLVLR